MLPSYCLTPLLLKDCGRTIWFLLVNLTTARSYLMWSST